MRIAAVVLFLSGCASALGAPVVSDGVPTCLDGDMVTAAVPACSTEVFVEVAGGVGSCAAPLAGVDAGRVHCDDGSLAFCGLPPPSGFCAGDWASECLALGGHCVMVWDPSTGTLGPLVAR